MSGRLCTYCGSSCPLSEETIAGGLVYHKRCLLKRNQSESRSTNDGRSVDWYAPVAAPQSTYAPEATPPVPSPDRSKGSNPLDFFLSGTLQNRLSDSNTNQDDDKNEEVQQSQNNVPTSPDGGRSSVLIETHPINNKPPNQSSSSSSEPSTPSSPSSPKVLQSTAQSFNRLKELHIRRTTAKPSTASRSDSTSIIVPTEEKVPNEDSVIAMDAIQCWPMSGKKWTSTRVTRTSKSIDLSMTRNAQNHSNNSGTELLLEERRWLEEERRRIDKEKEELAKERRNLEEEKAAFREKVLDKLEGLNNDGAGKTAESSGSGGVVGGVGIGKDLVKYLRELNKKMVEQREKLNEDVRQFEIRKIEWENGRSNV